ncbi:glutamyl-tRNA(Gln) amidotransferase subunit A [Thraustotheca clavata]|uniref:Glutamyl-tRNA(Gln) amidotransferase subunit A n=1 Tax=Thraustotheca clavata TaxID=74557 RepID=A0A1V9ZNW5_9STRA|nr:glutamyl-tRNA(Gln) amidotransferase subunit A [Thraustotheca clavata]
MGREDDNVLASYETLFSKYPGDTMDLQDLRAPRLTGNGLKLFAKLLRAPVVGQSILNKIKRDNRMIQVRELAATVHTMPLYYPLSTPSTELYELHATRAQNFTIANLVAYNVPETSAPFRHWTIRDYVRRYESGEITPVHVITTVIKAIEESNARDIPLRAFIQCHAQAALTEARESTERYAAKAPLGPLDGVPIAIKDEIEVRGYETTFGTSFLGSVNGVESEDCLPVARLRGAGAIIVGKTNMHEFGAGCFGINIHHGTARNPYNQQYMTGGSSSGSAAAVAAGIVPLAIGCDGGGSIRIPSGLCGVVGLKATFMRIPYNSNGCPSLSNVGPIAVTVQDAALAYAIMSGSDPEHAMSMVQPKVYLSTEPILNDLSHLRIGIFPEYLNGVDQEIITAYNTQVSYLQSHGASITNVKIPNLQAIHYAHNMTILTEMAQCTDVHYRRITEFSADVQINLELARSSLSAVEFLAAQRVRSYALKIMRDMFDTIDIFITPTTAILAPYLQDDVFKAGLSQFELTAGLMKYMILGNLVGIPGITVPIGLSKDGLPISIQLQAAHWNEDTLFQLARVIEAQCPVAKPAIYYSILDSLA